MDEPRITFKKAARVMHADYLIGTDNDGRDGTERRHYARFRVGYDKGGMNYFNGKVTPRSYSASISRVTEAEIILRGERIGTSESFTLFEGLGLGRSEPVARYSEKALKAFFEEAHAGLAELREESDRVAAFFEPVEVPA